MKRPARIARRSRSRRIHGTVPLVSPEAGETSGPVLGAVVGPPGVVLPFASGLAACVAAGVWLEAGSLAAGLGSGEDGAVDGARVGAAVGAEVGVPVGFGVGPGSAAVTVRALQSLVLGAYRSSPA